MVLLFVDELNFIAINFIFFNRRIVFEEVYHGQRLNTSDIERMFLKSIQECATKCSKTPRCRSFNSCEAGIKLECLLLSEDIYLNKSQLIEDSRCSHRGMKAESFPSCYENGSERSITDDSDPGNCAINLKRIDANCSDWKFVLVNFSNEFKEANESFCFSSSVHQDVLIPYGLQSREIAWIKWIMEMENFTEATKHCESIGGQLFGDLDGTSGQLLFLSKHNSQYVILGVSDWKHEGTWVNGRGEILNDKLFHLWAPATPDNGDNNQHFLYVYTDFEATVLDMSRETFGSFVCQMIFSQLTD